MSLVWREPPTDRRRVFTDAILAELRDNPGRWAVIRQYSYNTSKNNNAVKHPPDIEIRWARESTGSALYARALASGK